ncbi:50S ribosomal protein L25/general stress protein Ctc [Flexithrix dorotheae]|uniref:50S ribosomal protein L25/general stress protein Ctc n=1 Tax=Flexithrix dorotheae TaxID=70993 RepID=UPI00035DB5B8|nr:50S ribosomal protein L25/general stress protein Ctc [Flexithrix dorotheae]
MKTIEIVGYKREQLGKTTAKALRQEANVPSVLYGGEKNIHFHAPMILFRDLVYTPEVAFVKLNIEGDIHTCILQDIQFHPVSEIIMHADFLELSDDRPVTMEIPVKFQGSSPGILKGGKLVTKLRKVKVKSLPQHMPDNIIVSIDGLELGKSVKISSLEQKDYTILNNPMVTIASVEIPRALKSAQSKDGGDEGAAE